MSRIEEPQKEESLTNGLAVADQRIQVTYSFTEFESGKVSAISTAQRGWPSIELISLLCPLAGPVVSPILFCSFLIFSYAFFLRISQLNARCWMLHC